MSFLNILSEKLDSQEIYKGLSGKWESRFKVDGTEYALLASSVAGNGTEDGNNWMLEFENSLSHRISMGDSNPKIAKAFAEVVDMFIKECNPYSFYTYGSFIESIDNIITAVKKKVKKYNLIDDTADKKNEENGEVIEGNKIGKIQWTKMIEQEVTSHEDIGSAKSDKFETTYEVPKDIKANKAFMSGTKKADKLEKGDKSYELKTESVIREDANNVNPGDKFKSRKTNKVWEVTSADPVKDKCFMKTGTEKASFTTSKVLRDMDRVEKIGDSKFESFADFKSKKISENEFQKTEAQMKVEEDLTNQGYHFQGWKEGGSIVMMKMGMTKLNNEFKTITTDGTIQNESHFDDSTIITEGLNREEITRKARSVLKKFLEKLSGEKPEIDFVLDKQKLEDWIKSNEASIRNAWDITKHMVSPKELTFEEEILQGVGLNEGLLDSLIKQSPKLVPAVALILTIMATGSKVFAANDDADKAFDKMKSSTEKIVNIVKEQGSKIGKDVAKDLKIVVDDAKEVAKQTSKDIEKPVKKAADEVGKEVKKATGDAGEEISKGAEKVGDAIGDKAEEVKDNFKNFVQDKKAQEEIKNKAKAGVEKGTEELKNLGGKAKSSFKSMFKPKMNKQPTSAPGEAV